MTDENKPVHTPVPWVVYDNDADGYLEITAEARDGKIAIATIAIGFIQSFDDEQIANVAFIVEACNQHAALTLANKDMRRALESVRKRIRDVFVEDRVEDMIACRDCIDTIESALARNAP